MNEEMQKVRDNAKHPMRERVAFRLPWYKTQYWSGFLNGLWIGWLCGLPLAFVVYEIAKAVVSFIEAS